MYLTGTRRTTVLSHGYYTVQCQHHGSSFRFWQQTAPTEKFFPQIFVLKGTSSKNTFAARIESLPNQWQQMTVQHTSSVQHPWHSPGESQGTLGERGSAQGRGDILIPEGLLSPIKTQAAHPPTIITCSLPLPDSRN